ncbi:phage capsid family protein [Brevundimonas sp. Marseille-Q4549]
MAYSEVPADLERTKWDSSYWQEYVNMSGYAAYMSASPNALIQTNRDLIDGGKDIVMSLVGSLKGKGIGAGLLTGAEERLGFYPFRTRPVWRRNAVVVKKSMIQKSVVDILKANKDSLKIWSSDDMRDRITDALSVVAFDDARYDEDNGDQTGVPYAEATATQRNNWLTDNAIRALFGNSEANLVAGNMASSLANVDNVNDNWGATVISVAKGMARKRDRITGRRAIRPYRSDKDGREWFVLFVPTQAFNKIKADPDIKAFNKDSIDRSVESNPYFQGGDLIWDGVIIREITDLPVLGAVGTAGANVAAGYLCGAQALVVAWGQDPKSTERKDDDYQFIKGVGTEELRSIDKTFFKETGAVGPGTQHGIVTVFAAY